MRRLVWAVCAAAAAYQAIAIGAVARHWWRQRKARQARAGRRGAAARDFQPGVSILKPLRGLDPNTRDAFESHARQDYPEFEIFFCVREESDPACAEVRALQDRHPGVAVRLAVGAQAAENGKVGALMTLEREARYPVWVVNDSDIEVTPGYLREVVAPLQDEGVGVVTCPYRAGAQTAAGCWEALGIATDFMPSVMVAQALGVREFGLGSTLAFRAADLRAAGGFRAFADYVADDYQLAKAITRLGKRAVLSTYTVETSIGEASWRGVWRHQLRWARTIRLSKGLAYAGLPVAQAGVWVAVAALCGAWGAATGLAALRVGLALVSATVLRSKWAARWSWLAPVWDLYAFAVWAASYSGRTVEWRGNELALGAEGRIEQRVLG